MSRILARLLAVVPALALVAAPASADTGWMSATDGKLYKVDDETWLTQDVGVSAPAVDALATMPGDVLLGVQGGGPPHLVEVNTLTGATTDRGELDPDQLFSTLTAAADGTLFTSGSDLSTSALYTVDPDDASLTMVGTRGEGQDYVGLAGACGGDLLAVDVMNQLVDVDPASGERAVIGTLTFPINRYPIALAFNHADRALWLLTIEDNQEYVYAVDPLTAEITPTSYQSPSGADPRGLAFDSPAECRYPRKATTTYHARTKKFTGRVFSEWTPCTVDQKVQVFRQAKGPDEKLGTTWTGADGRFVLSKRLRKGGAYALAPSSSSAQTGRCLPARSILTH